MKNTVLMYGLKKCSTCVKAMKWLDEYGMPYQFVDYRDNRVEPGQLVQWAQSLGGWEKLINRSSMTWRQLPESLKQVSTESAYLALIGEHPTLIKRPVLTGLESGVAVGFSDKKYAALMG